MVVLSPPGFFQHLSFAGTSSHFCYNQRSILIQWGHGRSTDELFCWNQHNCFLLPADIFVATRKLEKQFFFRKHVAGVVQPAIGATAIPLLLPLPVRELQPREVDDDDEDGGRRRGR